MPVKGQEEARILIAERNVKNGQAWSALSDDEKEVFNPEIFYALAGVPNPLLSPDLDQDCISLHDDQDGDTLVPVPNVHKLTLEQDNLYHPLYESLANLQKVLNELGKPESGDTIAKVQRKSATAIEKYAHMVCLLLISSKAFLIFVDGFCF